MRLNVGCGPHYADGWHNVDAISGEYDTHPDQVVAIGEPLPFPDQSCERIYLGHLLEHIGWERLAAFLADCRRLLPPEGELLAIGPDLYRATQMWHEGAVGWDLVTDIMEHAGYADGRYEPLRHHWNCHEERVVWLLTECGFSAKALPMDSPELEGWPYVSRASWQCAVIAR